MGVHLRLDKRYKVDDDMVKRMKLLNKEGLSTLKISKMFDVSQHTVYYWLNDRYRRQKRFINAKRVSDNKKRVEHHKKQNMMFSEELALGYIAKQVNAYQYTKSRKDVFILGVSMKKHWIPYLKKYWHRGMLKLGY